MPVTTAENVFVGEGVTLEQYLKDVENKGGVSVIVDAQLSNTSKNPVENRVIAEELNKVFQSVSDGKALIASAITDKGITTEPDATFETMANNIAEISSVTEEIEILTPLIPAMKSDTTPQGFVSASYVYSGRPPWWAFSGNEPNINTGYWYWYCQPAGEYLQYEFKDEVKVERIEMWVLGGNCKDTYTIIVSSSDTGETYTDVAEGTFKTETDGIFLRMSIKLQPSVMKYIRFRSDKECISLAKIQAYSIIN